MSSLASNVLALILVVGISWIAMVALSAFFHRNRDDGPEDLFEQAARGGPTASVPVTDLSRPGAQRHDDVEPRSAVSVPRDLPCEICSGVGASTERGRLHPCVECEGTGVR